MYLINVFRTQVLNEHLLHTTGQKQRQSNCRFEISDSESISNRRQDPQFSQVDNQHIFHTTGQRQRKSNIIYGISDSIPISNRRRNSHFLQVLKQLRWPMLSEICYERLSSCAGMNKYLFKCHIFSGHLSTYFNPLIYRNKHLLTTRTQSVSLGVGLASTYLPTWESVFLMSHSTKFCLWTFKS